MPMTSARDIMGGFMDSDNDNASNGLRGSVLRAYIQEQNQMVVEGGVPQELNKALLHRAAGHCQEKHMTDRVVDYCKTQLFRKVKFTTAGEEMTMKALTMVMDALNMSGGVYNHMHVSALTVESSVLPQA